MFDYLMKISSVHIGNSEMLPALNTNNHYNWSDCIKSVSKHTNKEGKGSLFWLQLEYAHLGRGKKKKKNERKNVFSVCVLKATFYHCHPSKQTLLMEQTMQFMRHTLQQNFAVLAQILCSKIDLLWQMSSYASKFNSSYLAIPVIGAKKKWCQSHTPFQLL